MTNITNDPNAVLELIQRSRPRVVGIDGNDGVGKTSLAKNIAKLGYKMINVDDYLIKRRNGYFRFIKFDKIKKTIEKNKEKSMVIEGVLLLKILVKLQVKVNLLVYVADSWIDDWFEEYQGKYCRMSLKSIIEDVERITNRLNKTIDPMFKSYKMKGLRREIYEYTYKYKPWQKSDITLKKI